MKEYLLRDLSQPLTASNLKLLHTVKVQSKNAPIFKYLTAYFLFLAADRPFSEGAAPVDDAPLQLSWHKSKLPLNVKFSLEHNLYASSGPGYYVIGHTESNVRYFAERWLDYAFSDTPLKLNKEEVQAAITQLCAIFNHQLMIVEFLGWKPETYCHVYRLDRADIKFWFNEVLIPLLLDTAEDTGIATVFDLPENY